MLAAPLDRFAIMSTVLQESCAQVDILCNKQSSNFLQIIWAIYRHQFSLMLSCL